MDWLTTGAIIVGIFAVTAVVSLFIPKDRDPEIHGDNTDGPVIPTPGPDGSMMGAGRQDWEDAEDADMEGRIEDGQH